MIEGLIKVIHMGYDKRKARHEAQILLEEEWHRQAMNLAKLFAKETGQTEGEYIRTLPKFKPQPKEFKGRFDIPVIVETRIPLGKMLELAGIVNNYPHSVIKDWMEGKFKTPDMPYTTWINDGTPNLNTSVETVRRFLKSDERGGNVFDVIALYLMDRDILKKHSLDSPGSHINPSLTPLLFLSNEAPTLDFGVADRVDPISGTGPCPVTAGRKIKT